MDDGTIFVELRIRVVQLAPDLTGSKVLQDKVRHHPRFTVHVNTEITAMTGKNGKLTEVVARDRGTGEELRWQPKAAFVFIGLDPNTAFLRDVVDLDDWGFIRTDDAFATSLRGVFAADDARAGATKQLGAAVGDGIAALIAIRSYLQRIDDARRIDVNS